MPLQPADLNRFNDLVEQVPLEPIRTIERYSQASRLIQGLSQSDVERTEGEELYMQVLALFTAQYEEDDERVSILQGSAERD